MEGKYWWNSKTILLNMIMGLCVAVLPAVPAAQGVSDFLQNNMELIGVVWAGLNIVLRFITKEKVKLFD